MRLHTSSLDLHCLLQAPTSHTEPLFPVASSSNLERKFRGHQTRSPASSLIFTTKINSYWCLSLGSFVSQWVLLYKANFSFYIWYLPCPAFPMTLSCQLHNCFPVASVSWFSVRLPVFKTKHPQNSILFEPLFLCQAIFLALSFSSSLKFWKELFTLQLPFLL